MHTRYSIRQMLLSRPASVVRGICVLHDMQTADEQRHEITRHKNYRGFSKQTVTAGTQYALKLKSGQRLDPAEWRHAKSIAMYHARQLAEIANEKARRQYQSSFQYA